MRHVIGLPECHFSWSSVAKPLTNSGPKVRRQQVRHANKVMAGYHKINTTPQFNLARFTKTWTQHCRNTVSPMRCRHSLFVTLLVWFLISAYFLTRVCICANLIGNERYVNCFNHNIPTKSSEIDKNLWFVQTCLQHYPQHCIIQHYPSTA